MRPSNQGHGLLLEIEDAVGSSSLDKGAAPQIQATVEPALAALACLQLCLVSLCPLPSLNSHPHQVSSLSLFFPRAFSGLGMCWSFCPELSLFLFCLVKSLFFSLALMSF